MKYLFNTVLGLYAVAYGLASATPPPGNLVSRIDKQDCGGFVESKENGSYTFDELWNLQKKFWDHFLYPNNLYESQKINSTLFDPNVEGRVDISRTFEGVELNTEYIFGLFTNPDQASFIGIPIDYKIVKFTGNQNVASASTIVTFNHTTFGVLMPVTIDTFLAWNKEGQIWQYDATFRWFGYLLDTLVGAVGKSINATSTDEAKAAVAGTLAKTLCTTHQTYCNGTDQQYPDAATCFDFLTKQIRFGQDYELGRNTFLCRSLHGQMIPYRPSVHCPHIGPSGGGMCVDDQSYGDKVLQNFFTNAPFIPYGYAM